MTMADSLPAILRIDDVVALVNMSRATVWRRVRDDQFPHPVRLGGANSRAVGWRRSEVEAWIAALQAA